MSSYHDDQLDIHDLFKMFSGTVQDQVKARLEAAHRRYEWSRRDLPRPADDVIPLSLNGLPITELPPIPEWVTQLDISDTRITELDCAQLPRNLLVLTAERTNLRVLRNFDHLTALRELDLSYAVWLERIEGRIPRSLRSLTLRSCASLTQLQPLGPTHLWWVNLQGCEKLTELPSLPPMLATLQLDRSGIKELPFLPDSLRDIVLQNGACGAYNAREEFTDAIRESQRTALRTQRFSAIHEELMSACWHPRRVESWLLQGESVLDMMMGC